MNFTTSNDLYRKAKVFFTLRVQLNHHGWPTFSFRPKIGFETEMDKKIREDDEALYK